MLSSSSSFCSRKSGHCKYSPAVAGSGKPIQQAVLPNWSAWNLTEQLPSGIKEARSLVILKHASLFLDSYTEQVSSPVSCSVSAGLFCQGEQLLNQKRLD